MPAPTSLINRRSQQLPVQCAHRVALTQQSAMLNERPRNDRSPMNLRDVTAAATDQILDAAPDHGATVPARTWLNAVPTRYTQLEISETTPDDNIIELDITGPTQAQEVYLDPSAARELIAEIQARLPVIDPS